MKRILLLLLLLSDFAFTFADPPGPPGPGGDPGGGGGVPVGSPIDGETIFLLAVAVAYGIYKLIEFRRNKSLQNLPR